MIKEIFKTAGLFMLGTLLMLCVLSIFAIISGTIGGLLVNLLGISVGVGVSIGLVIMMLLMTGAIGVMEVLFNR